MIAHNFFGGLHLTPKFQGSANIKNSYKLPNLKFLALIDYISFEALIRLQVLDLVTQC